MYDLGEAKNFQLNPEKRKNLYPEEKIAAEKQKALDLSKQVERTYLVLDRDNVKWEDIYNKKIRTISPDVDIRPLIGDGD